MKPNVGGIDRVIRVIAGVVIIGLGVAYHSWWGAIGLVPLATALCRWCPPYALFGISTCPRETGGGGQPGAGA
ncbi:MAG: DUF2892 domain-containing protein [Gemmatimonadota bacterium]